MEINIFWLFSRFLGKIGFCWVIGRLIFMSCLMLLSVVRMFGISFWVWLFCFSKKYFSCLYVKLIWRYFNSSFCYIVLFYFWQIVANNWYFNLFLMLRIFRYLNLFLSHNFKIHWFVYPINDLTASPAP